MQLNMCLPKVSIIIPVYNVESYIERCLMSVGRQSYRNLEIIVVDDCGHDASIKKVFDYKSAHQELDLIIVHHANNRGLSAARNTGLEKSTGDYVYFLDSDDDITPDCIESLVLPLAIKEFDLVVGDYNVVGANYSSSLHLPEGGVNSNKDIIKAYAEGKWYVMAWNKLCRRQFLVENAVYFKEGLIHEDVLWTFMVACKAQSLYVVKHPVYNYYVRSSSIMTSMSIERDANIYVEVFNNIASFVNEEGYEYAPCQYALIEGKKTGILYSLLQKEEIELYKDIYRKFRKLPFVSPWVAYRRGVIGFARFCRDLHYLLPIQLGSLYKYVFYLVIYKFRGKKIEGAVWS